MSTVDSQAGCWRSISHPDTPSWRSQFQPSFIAHGIDGLSEYWTLLPTGMYLSLLTSSFKPVSRQYRRSLQRPNFITERPPEEFLLANLTQEADITCLLFMREELFLLIRCQPS